MRFNIKIALHGAWVTTVATSVGSYQTKKLKAEEVTSPPLVKKIENFANKSCIVVVGSTGTGKSSTIAKYTKQNVEVSSGASSKTRYCQVFSNTRVPSDPVWIDTVGYDDSTNRNDEDNFKEVLKFIDKHDLTDVHAIVWTVSPTPRMDAKLQKQAHFINQFGEGHIWQNVIIVAKQPGSFNLEQATQGAKEAARLHCPSDTEIKSTGFTYIDDTLPDEIKDFAFPEEVRKKMLLVTDQQVYDELHELLMKEIQSPIQLVFRDSLCLDCGTKGDERLLESYCHMESILMHPEHSVFFHPEEREYYHPLDLEVYHSGLLRFEGGPNKSCETARNSLAVASPAMFFLDPTTGILSASAALGSYFLCDYLSTPIEEKWTCCGGLNGSAGCRTWWRCCRRLPDHTGCLARYPCCMGPIQAQGCSRKYKCCGQLENTSLGCKKICKKCLAPWGTASNKCFVKSHNLVKINQEYKNS